MADNMNVKFLKGNQTKLDTLTTSVAGAFYLAEDTCRLYFGTGSGKPVPVNEQVTIVSEVSQLPNPARAESIIYYAQKENILCIADKVNGTNGWMQINPQDGNTSINKLTISTPVENVENGSYTYTFTIQEQDKNGTTAGFTPHTATLTITKDMIADLAVNVEVGLETSIADNIATISTNGVGANSGSAVKVVAGENITIEQGSNSNEIKINAADSTYSLVSAKNGDNAKITLQDGNGSPKGAVDFAAGAKLDVNIESNVVTYSHETASSAGSYGGAVSGGTINAQTVPVTNFTVDDYGHVTAASTQNVEITNTTYTQVEPVVGDKEGSIKVGLTDQNGTSTYATSGQIFYNKITVDGGEEQTIYNQGNLGSFYSAAAIDTKLKAIDAMTYRGTIEETADIPTTDVHNGDTYKVNKEGTYTINGSSIELHVGDILIANAEENSDGVIPAEDLSWDIIHAGDDVDTKYVMSVANNAVTLQDSVAGGTQTFTIAAGDCLNASTENNTITIDHNESGVHEGTYGGAGGETGYGTKIAVPQFTVDLQGHITAAETKEYTLPLEHEYTFEPVADTETIYLTEDEVRKASLQFAGDEWILADLTEKEDLATNGKDGLLTITHKDVNRVDNLATEETAIDYEQILDVVVNVDSDDKGHITGITTTKYKLPTKDVYALSGSTLETLSPSTGASGVKFTNTLTDKLGGTTSANFGLYSESLNISLDNTNKAAKVELVWGSF